MILVTDDEKPIRDIISYQLKKEQYDVLTAENGREALDLIKSNPVDLLILDLMMPDMDGYEVIKNVPKSLPIIVLSAKDDEISKVVALEMGADDYLPKPFSKVELLARIHACLRKYRLVKIEPKDEILHLGDLEINVTKYLVTESGKEIEVSKIELNLLKIFAKNPKRVYTREELLNEIWGTDCFIDNRVVYTTIHRLRDKIQDKDILLTKRGFGYYGEK